MRVIGVLAACVVLSACQTQPAPQEIYTPKELTAAQVTAVQNGVRGALKDPESARFGSIVAGTNSKGTIISCGWVNAKNSFGGYTGEKPFMGVLTSGGFAPVAVGGDRNEVEVTMRMCARGGLVI